MSTLDEKYMRLAIEEARKCKPEDSAARPSVGVVVVKGEEVLACAHRGEMAAGEHAEFTVLEKKLGDSILAHSTVYTTLEPCTCRTAPKIPCALRLIERRVARVVIGMMDPNPQICGRGLWLLRESRVSTDLFPDGLMCEIEDLNRAFIRAHRPPLYEGPNPAPVTSLSKPETAVSSATSGATHESAGRGVTFDLVIKAFLEKDLPKADELFRNYEIDQGADAKRVRVDYLSLRYRFERSGATLIELDGLSHDATVGAAACIELGELALDDLNFELAITWFESAFSRAVSDVEKAAALRWGAIARHKLERTDEAKRMLRSAHDLAPSLDSSALSTLYARSAEVFGNSKFAKACMLLVAAQNEPAESARRFDAAYALSEASMTSLSFLQYGIHLSDSSTSDYSANNAGVAAGILEMPGLAADYFRRGIRVGETLPAANLARRLIAANLLSDADEILREARKCEKVHPNIGAAIEELRRRQELEKERLKVVKERGVHDISFAVGYADALLRAPLEANEIPVVTPGGDALVLTRNIDGYNGEWGDGDDRQRITLLVDGRASAYRIDKLNGSGEVVSELSCGYSYFAKDGVSLHMRSDGDEGAKKQVWSVVPEKPTNLLADGLQMTQKDAMLLGGG